MAATASETIKQIRLENALLEITEKNSRRLFLNSYSRIEFCGKDGLLISKGEASFAFPKKAAWILLALARRGMDADELREALCEEGVVNPRRAVSLLLKERVLW